MLHPVHHPPLKTRQPPEWHTLDVDTLTGRRRTSSPGWSGSSETEEHPAAACHNSSAGPLTGLNGEEDTKSHRAPAWPSGRQQTHQNPPREHNGPWHQQNKEGKEEGMRARPLPRNLPTPALEAAQKMCNPMGTSTLIPFHTSLLNLLLTCNPYNAPGGSIHLFLS